MPDVVRESDIMVPMRDGIRLATDVYRPAQGVKPLPGQFPVILERTPYGKAKDSRSEVTLARDKPYSRAEIAEYFVRHGYVVVFQDCRGRFGSEGAFTKYLDDGPDGYDCIEWIGQQDWYNGRIGMMGLSYAAHTQAAAACLNPPGLACLFMDSGGFANAYQGGIRQGGAFELKQATWAYKNALDSPEAVDPKVQAALRAEDMREWFTRMPWRPGHSPVTWVKEYEDYLLEQWQHGEFDDFWKQVGIYAEGFYDQFSDAPMVHMSSWYDAYPRTATDNYVGLKARKKSSVRLLMGPWTHGNRSQRVFGDVDFGEDAPLDGNVAEDHRALRLRWFDRWLRDVDNGVDGEPAVRLFVMGGGSGRRTAEGRLDHGGRWRDEADWPLPDTRFTEYYLHPDGGLSPERPTADEASLAYDYDPRNPVPTIGGTLTSGEPVMVGGAFDQREDPRFFGCRPPYLPLASRHDVLVFETSPLTEDVEVTGPIVVRLWIASDCPDTDFTMKLIDVYPPSDDWPRGFAMNITDGIMRCRYRDSWADPSPMIPGEVYEIAVEPFPASNLFKAGHRIRLDISSSNFPHFDVNPNTGEPEGASRRTRVATNTVFMDGARPSHVLLPVIPARR
ncbi:MAG: CocE/NonD family hydrolase [Acetobacterales bacterium]